MPTENEYKFFLRRDKTTLDTLGRIVHEQQIPSSIIQIEQGLLATDDGLTLRVRHSRFSCGKVDRWLLTMKQDVGDRVVEIEQLISTRDGIALWGECYSKLQKTRYKIEHGGQTWEVDRFFDGDRIYCVLAEIELPEGAPPPAILPPFIAENLLYSVPQGDGRFSNKKLWNITKTDALYDEYQSDEARV
jgi:CYTH domain-containing protein